jgi:hypothetical protein
MIAAYLAAIWATLALGPTATSREVLSLQAAVPAEPAPAAQLNLELGGGLHLGQGAGVLDLHFGWRRGRWEIGVLAENVADVPGWDVQRDDRALFAMLAGREPAPAEDLTTTLGNPRNVRLFVAVSF